MFLKYRICKLQNCTRFIVLLTFIIVKDKDRILVVLIDILVILKAVLEYIKSLSQDVV